MKKIIFVSKYPIFSAICAATASFAGLFIFMLYTIFNLLIGKLAFQKENILDGEYSYLLHCIIRAIFFLIMLNLNKFMFQFLFLSWKYSGALLTSSLNFVVNNLLNVYLKIFL